VLRAPSQLFYHVLRAKVAAELVAHRAWYVDRVFLGDVRDYQNDLDASRTEAEWSATTQLVALANVLRRPIALLASLADMSGPEAYRCNSETYLPARHAPADCCPHPLLLAWSSRDRQHYVPLCRARDNSAPALPVACRPKTCLPADASEEAYIPVGCWCLSPTSKEQLPARSLLLRTDRVFETRLLQDGASLAVQALSALPAAAAVHLLAHDGAFHARAAAIGPGVLAASALALHAAGREASALLTLRALRDDVDSACTAACKRLYDALPPPHAAALRCVIIDDVLAQLELTLGQAALELLLDPIDVLLYRTHLEANRLALQNERGRLMRKHALPALVAAHEQAAAAPAGAPAAASAAALADAAVPVPAAVALDAAPASASEAAAPSSARKRKAEDTLVRPPPPRRDGRATLERLLELQPRAPRWAPTHRRPERLEECVRA
jgi:hypothetical protein